MELFERLKVARKRRGLTQQQVADHFEIARVSVTQWEGGTSRPDQAKFAALSDLYDVPLDWLLGKLGEDSLPALIPKGNEPTLIKRSKPRRVFLREWREYMHAKVADLAKAIDRDQDYYEYLEQYPHKFSIEQLDILATKMGVSFDQLWFPPPAAVAKKSSSEPARKKARR